jgi:hypothetical protein
VTTGDPTTDAVFVLLVVAVLLGALVIPAALLEVVLGPEKDR